MNMNKNNIIKNELIKISNTIGLTAQNVVKEAEPKDSLLHDYFEWDDKIAGYEFRLAQARSRRSYVLQFKQER